MHCGAKGGFPFRWLSRIADRATAAKESLRIDHLMELSTHLPGMISQIVQYNADGELSKIRICLKLVSPLNRSLE